MSQLYIHENLLRIQPLVQKILYRYESVTEFPATAVTFKIMSRSSKSNHFFVMSQLYIYSNLVRIQPLVHKILCRQESVMPTPTGSAPKQYAPLNQWLQQYVPLNQWPQRHRKVTIVGLHCLSSLSVPILRVNMTLQV